MNELVYSNVPGPTKCYWIGISDIEHEDKYVYASDDKPILWTNFRQKKTMKNTEEKYTFDLRPGFPVSNNSRNCLLYSCDRSYPFKVRQTGPGSRDPADYCGFFMNFMINRDFVDAGPPRDSWLSRANHPAVRLIF